VKPGETRFEVIDQDGGKGRVFFRLIPFDHEERSGPDSNLATVVFE
jgi:hypothetical protein